MLFVVSNDDYRAEVRARVDGINNLSVVFQDGVEGIKQLLRDGFFDVVGVHAEFDGNGDGTAIGNTNILSLLDSLRQNAPRTPTYVLTKNGLRISSVNFLIEHSHHVDVWATGTAGATIRLFEDVDFDSFVLAIREISATIDLLENVRIDSAGKSLTMRPEHKRIIRLFSQKLGGVSCRVTDLHGGLSSARVVKLCVEDANGGTRMDAVAKINTNENSSIELGNYLQQVIRLPAQAYAPNVGTVDAGAGNYSGIFYRLVDPGDVPLNRLLPLDVARASRAVKKLSETLAPWFAGEPRRRLTVGDMRRVLINDDQVSMISEKHTIDWVQHIERIEFHARFACIHGDLHGGNVFVGPDDRPCMIDFGCVSTGPAVLDPITLELSLFFHPQTRECVNWLPNLERPNWVDLDHYLIDCPYSAFIRACRAWSYEVAGGDVAVLAASYAYLMRQLKYDDVDPEIVLALLHSIKETMLNAD